MLSIFPREILKEIVNHLEDKEARAFTRVSKMFLGLAREVFGEEAFRVFVKNNKTIIAGAI